MTIELPQRWSNQMLLLAGLLGFQFIFFTLFIVLPSEVFQSHVASRLAWQNSGPSVYRPDSPMTQLEGWRWHWQTVTGESQEVDMTKPHALRRAWQLRFHSHSKNPYPFKWLEHISASYTTREELQRHMNEGTIYTDLSPTTTKQIMQAVQANVVYVSDENFQQEVYGDEKQTVFVEFFAPWCGHCKVLKPNWDRAATLLAGVAKLVAVDATVYKALAKKHGVQGYPTLKLFLPGKKDQPVSYTNGERSPEKLVKFVKDQIEEMKTGKVPVTVSDSPSTDPPAPIIIEPPRRTPLDELFDRMLQAGTSPKCDTLVGSGLLKSWDATKEVFCTSGTGTHAVGEGGEETLDTFLQELLLRASKGISIDTGTAFPPSSLTCRSTTLQHMPPPTAPHSFCSGSNFFLDLSTLQPGADAPRFRAGYIMGKGNHYHYTPRGSIFAQCTHTGKYEIGKISADHQRDVIDAWAQGGLQAKQKDQWSSFLQLVGKDQGYARALLNHPAFSAPNPSSYGPNELIVLPHPVLLLTRENGEHVNLYHTMTDFWNTWLMFKQFNLKREEVRILFLDNHGPSPFDVAWQNVFSGGGSVLRINHLLKDDKWKSNSILIQSGIIVPPGYSSPLYRFLLEEEHECREKTDLFVQFARFFLQGFQVHFHPWRSEKETLLSSANITQADEQKAIRNSFLTPISATEPFLHLVVISRKPYDNFVNHKRIARQIFNEATLLDFVRENKDGKYSNLRVDTVDMAHITFKQQLSLIASTDLLIGMHGAALSHTMFLPPWGALLELHPSTQRWQCFKHQTEWSGHTYFPWRSQTAEREDATGSGLDVDPASFAVVLDEAIKTVRAKRQQVDKEVEQKIAGRTK